MFALKVNKNQAIKTETNIHLSEYWIVTIYTKTNIICLFATRAESTESLIRRELEALCLKRIFK
jgi:hypothetical protein